jgi:hypothetical protein
MSALYSPAYLNAFQALAQRMHFDRHLAPNVAVADWQTVIDELKVTTDSYPCELDNDLDVVREPLETFLIAEQLALFPEHAYFAQCIRALDTEFKVLTVQQVGRDKRTDFRWWKDRVPKYWIELMGR